MSIHMPRLSRIAVYPIKSLDPAYVERTTVIENAALAHDREYAIVDADGEYVNGKRTRQVHRLHAAYDDDLAAVRIRDHGTDPADARRFHLEDDRADLAAWLSSYFGYAVDVVRDRAGGHPDDTDLSGPTVISTPTLRAVASWFPGIDVGGMRRRLRANLEVGAADGGTLPAFWEDRLAADRGYVRAFTIGDCELLGVNPCQRCVVPSRDPDTGEEYEGFRTTFVEKRRETFPPWADSDRFDHHFRLMINTRIPEREWGSRLAVGDRVAVGDRREIEE